MPASDPFPGKPAVDDDIDATVVAARINALFAAFGAIANADIAAAAEIAGTKLASSFLDKVGVSGTSTVRRGKSVIATEESRTNAAYGTMTTPDRVSSLVLPTDGLIVVSFQALWKNSVAGAGRAGIFLGANQVKVSQSGAPATTGAEGVGNNFANAYVPLWTAGYTLSGHTDNEHGAPVTTGQVIGAAAGAVPSPMLIFAAAGTYTIEVRYKSASGSVSVKNRSLLAYTIGF